MNWDIRKSHRPVTDKADLRLNGIVRTFTSHGITLKTIMNAARRGSRQHYRWYYREANMVMLNPAGVEEEIPAEIHGMRVVLSDQMPVGQLFVIHVNMDEFEELA
ncbi:MAG TPA: hypothetical protein PKD55_00390 [Bellilinea sp.]|nr:hypothetical protein [Bellilinea sp.]